VNITVLANRDLASNYALNLLLPVLAGEHQLRVFLSARVGSGEPRPQSLQLLTFMEQTLFNELLFPALAENKAAGQLKSFSALAAYTQESPVVLNAINSEAGLEQLAATDPDLIISIRYGGILKESAIAIPRHGVINLHSGQLPDYRGVMATFWALLNGEEELQMTLHQITDGSIDTGAILDTCSLPVVETRSYLWHLLQLYPAGCELITAAVKRIANGQPLNKQPQQPGGNYYSFPGEEELARFRQKGYSLFELTDITEIANRYLESPS
jgi:methionyl-tRNA formyltransferase